MARGADRWVTFATPEIPDEERIVQGVVKSYDPGSGDGVVLCDTDLAEYDLDADALVDSVFRMLRQGQRVIFDLTSEGLATRLRLGSEVDMGTPGFPPADAVPAEPG
ncbi:MAG: cold shock protein [Acidimicrobiaceae bacterium]|jgi:CspA family cold shock protein